MKKIALIAALLLFVAACQKKQTEMKTEGTVIEGRADTLTVDTDTIAYAGAGIMVTEIV